MEGSTDGQGATLIEVSYAWKAAKYLPLARETTDTRICCGKNKQMNAQMAAARCGCVRN